MIIIKVMGGLGNQMFQYALYKSFEAKGVAVRLDDEGLRKNGNQHNGLELERVFGLEYCRASSNDLVKVCGNPYTLVNRVLRRVFKINRKNFYSEEEYSYKPWILGENNMYLNGYWQSEKYFSDIRDKLLDDFNFLNCNDISTQKLVSEINSCESVAIHFRRGDYLTNGNDKLYGNICTQEYYENAIMYLEKKYSDLVFFVFSDDIEWTKESFISKYNVFFVEANKREENYKDMYLMSQCKHNIIANSSFSWWGAWLNKNPDKNVLMPSKWLNQSGEYGIYCDDWIVI